MKRRSLEDVSKSDAAKDSIEDPYNRDAAADGWYMCSLGCDGGQQQEIQTNISPTSTYDAPGADIFLNQTSQTFNKVRRRRSRTKNKDQHDNVGVSSSKHTDLSSLIASELSRLSIEDREKALEEIHGVVEVSDEDPMEIQNLLDQVKEELKRIRYKQAYEKAAFLSSAYVTDPDFVIYFLRTDNYNPRKAAIRLVEHFKYKLELFGEHTLVRDIMYDDLSEVEKNILNSGFVYCLPKPDRAGRHVMICNLSEFLKTGTLMDMNRAVWYISLRYIQMFPSLSKLGVVGVYFAHGMCNVFENLSREHFVPKTAFLGNALPYKFASVHFCFEKNILASALQTTLMMSLGKYARIRLRSHCGSRMESTYTLKSFGIDLEEFESDGLMGHAASAHSFLQQCQKFDQYCQQKQNTRLLPRPNDVLLGRGRPFQLYPGNLALTAIIDQYRDEYTTSKKMHKKAITAKVVNDILRSGGRFLKKVENGKGVDWDKVDFETARLKVSHSFRTMSKWHADNEDEENENRGDGQKKGRGEDESLESISPINTDTIQSLGLIIKPISRNETLSNKRRKGQNY